MISVLSAVAEIERENILVQTMEGRKPVSYTHLDVYKRQEYRHSGLKKCPHALLSKGKPNENCVLDNDITLEDAYIYLTNS